MSEDKKLLEKQIYSIPFILPTFLLKFLFHQI